MERSSFKCGHVNPMSHGEEFDRSRTRGHSLIYSRYDVTSRITRTSKTGDWTGVPRSQMPPSGAGPCYACMVATTTDTVPGHTNYPSGRCDAGLVCLRHEPVRRFFAYVTYVVGGHSGVNQKVLCDAHHQVLA